MTPTPIIPTPKERFLSSEQVAREWTDLMFSAAARQAIDLALLDYIQGVSAGENFATAAAKIQGAIGFSKHLAMFGVARVAAMPVTASELEHFDPVAADLALQKKFQKPTTPS